MNNKTLTIPIFARGVALHFLNHRPPNGEETVSEPQGEANSEQPTSVSEADLWQSCIGPSKSIQFNLKDGWAWRPAYLYYQEKFRQFHTPEGPRFALSWHWPACDVGFILVVSLPQNVHVCVSLFYGPHSLGPSIW